MKIIEISDSSSGSTARIAVDQGFNCFRFVARLSADESVDVIAAADNFAEGGQPSSHNGIPLLFPFTNRIREGRYSWEGAEYFLPPELVPCDNTGNAIHGFCLDRPWRITSQSEDSVTGEFRLGLDAPDRLPLWPTDAELSVRYSVRGTCLRADFTVRNPTDSPLPWGLGTHPYFRVPLSPKSEPGHCTVYAPVSKIWELENFLPTGKILDPDPDSMLDDAPYFDVLNVDAVYTQVELKNGISVCRIVDEKAGTQVEQRSHADFREIVAFTPPWMSAVCLEPYTCVTDAINLQQHGVDAGLQVLGPGAEWRGWIEIEALPLLC